MGLSGGCSPKNKCWSWDKGAPNGWQGGVERNRREGLDHRDPQMQPSSIRKQHPSGFLRDIGVLPHTLPVLRDTLAGDMIWGSQSPEIWDSVDLGGMDFCFKELCCIHAKRRCFNPERV